MRLFLTLRMALSQFLAHERPLMFIAGLGGVAKDDGPGNGSNSRRQSVNEGKDKHNIRSPDTAEETRSPQLPSAVTMDGKDGGAEAAVRSPTSPSTVSDQFDTLKASLRRLI